MYHHKWLYHETLAPTGKLLKSDAEEAALGEGWVDTPAKFGVDAPHEPTEAEAADIGRPEEPGEITMPPTPTSPILPGRRNPRR